jgi:hypothetical protein
MNILLYLVRLVLYVPILLICIILEPFSSSVTEFLRRDILGLDW